MAVIGRTDIEAIAPLTRIWWQKWKEGSAADNAAVLKTASNFRIRNLLMARTIAET